MSIFKHILIGIYCFLSKTSDRVLWKKILKSCWGILILMVSFLHSNFVQPAGFNWASIINLIYSKWRFPASSSFTSGYALKFLRYIVLLPKFILFSISIHLAALVAYFMMSFNAFSPCWLRDSQQPAQMQADLSSGQLNLVSLTHTVGTRLFGRSTLDCIVSAVQISLALLK